MLLKTTMYLDLHIFHMRDHKDRGGLETGNLQQQFKNYENVAFIFQIRKHTKNRKARKTSFTRQIIFWNIFSKKWKKHLFNCFIFLKKWKNVFKNIHEIWRKINDRGCQIKWNVFKSGHKMATFRDTHTFSPLVKIDDFTQNVALIFGYWSLWKKNTRHFLWSREKPKNRWYFYVEMTSSSIVPLLFENPGSCGSLTENCCTRGVGAVGDSS